MKLNHYLGLEELSINDPSELAIIESLNKLKEGDVLVLEATPTVFVQTRCESLNLYNLGYRENSILYDSELKTVLKEYVEKAFIAFLNFGSNSKEFQSILPWVKSDYQLEEAPVIESLENSGGDVYQKPHNNGIEFEEFVAKVLSNAGWSARLTKKSGDQGLDLLAFDSKYRVALQCKRYAQPVGNSAVQEVHAAADYSGSTHAVVVTTSSYTSSATQLAEVLGVVLLREDDLADLRSHLAFTPARLVLKNVPSMFRDNNSQN